MLVASIEARPRRFFGARLRGKNKKSRGFLLCFFPAGTLPQVLCQSDAYCSGVTVPSQAEIVAEEARTTASANEQK